MDVKGIEYLSSPQSLRNSEKCIDFVPVPFLCIIYMLSLWFHELLWMMIRTFQRGFLRNFSGKCSCLSLHYTDELSGWMHTTRRSLTGSLFLSRCTCQSEMQADWIENNFLISTVKSDCLDSTCYWVQFVRIMLRISLLHLWTVLLGSSLFLWCHYIFVIWGNSALIKWDWKCFIFFWRSWRDLVLIL